MYHLKCNNCGQLNEVKTEFLIFCSNCNKKLDNNFPDWQKKNPGKSLDEFKKLMCISDEDIMRISLQPKPNKKMQLKYWILIGIGVIFIITFGYGVYYFIGLIGSKEFSKYFLTDKTSKQILNQKWLKEFYGSNGLTVETPVKLTKKDLPIPANIRNLLEKIESYQYLTGKGIKIMVNNFKFNTVVAVAALQGAADGSINESRKQPGVSDLNYTEEPNNKNGIHGLIQKGTFSQNNIRFEFINTFFVSGLNLYEVKVEYQDDDDVGRTAAKRIIESIDFKQN